MKKHWNEYKMFTADELKELIDRAEGLRDWHHRYSAEYKIACLDLEIATRKLLLLSVS